MWVDLFPTAIPVMLILKDGLQKSKCKRKLDEHDLLKNANPDALTVCFVDDECSFVLI